jgi:peroxiredoxin
MMTSSLYYDINNKIWRRYFRNPIDNIKYFYDYIDTNTYKLTFLDEEKLILGYNCKKARITSFADTSIIYYTNELGIDYSPKGSLNGFVLEYHFKSNYVKTEKLAISIIKNPTENYSPPTGYIETTLAKYFSEDKKFYSKENRRPMVKENERAPAFMIADMNGNIFDMEMKRGKVLVFNYWFIGCGGCVYEIPELNKWRNHFNKNKDVEFYAFTGDSRSQLYKFFQKHRFDFNIVPNARHIHHLYGINAFPTTLIIDKKGIVSKIYKGIIGEDEFENIIKEIEKLLAE